MPNRKIKLVVLAAILSCFLFGSALPISAQEFGAGGKLVGTSPYIFSEAKVWIFAAELAVGLDNSNPYSGEHREGSLLFSVAGKVYPLEVMGLSPYLGFANQFSDQGYERSRAFGGLEFEIPIGFLPLSAFAGGDFVSTAEGGFEGWLSHVGIKYRFSFL
ncbi:MAG: hypothetical protein ACOCZX_06030 [Candidatus Bipolaricaulota bacterium]